MVRTGLVALCCAVAIALVAPSLALTGGLPCAPIDDSSIHFQYARSLFDGHHSRYNPQDPPTSGNTSLLYPLLIAIGFAMGLEGQNILWWAWAIGLAAYIALALGAFAFARLMLASILPQLEQGQVALMAGVAASLVVCAGAVVWAAMSGMETVLMAALAMWTIYAVAATHFRSLDDFNRVRVWHAAILAVLAALTRPEGAILAGLVALWIMFSRGAHGAHGGLAQRIAMVALIGVSIVAQPMVNWLMTGAATASGFVAKTWLNHMPPFPALIATRIAETFADTWLNMLSGYRRFLMAPLLAALGIGLCAVGVVRAAQRRAVNWPMAIGGAWVMGGTIATSLLYTAGWHYSRYAVQFVALLTVLGFCAACALAVHFIRNRRTALIACVVVFGLGTLPTTAYAWRSFLDSTLITREQQMAMALWLRENTPKDARVGVADAGLLRYLSDRYTFDLVGLTTPHMALPGRNYSGSIYEQMERDPHRPDYFATYLNLYGMSYFEQTNLFAELVGRYPVPEIPTIVMASAGEQHIYKADWSLLNSGDALYQPDVIARLAGLKLVDALDVADLQAEQAHAYRWWLAQDHGGYPTEAKQLTYRHPSDRVVMDGGRMITGGEEMTVHGRANEDLWIVMRAHPQNGAGLRVFADGRLVGVWRYPQLPGHWLETVFRVPATFVQRNETRLRLEAITDDPGFKWHSPFYYWFYQGNATYAEPQPPVAASARFGPHIELLGHDPISTKMRAGDALIVRTYWRTAQSLDARYKIFVHVIGSDGAIVAQSDGYPAFDTRSTETWSPGEVIVDERAIPLPADAMAGEYRVNVGLYADVEPFARLPVAETQLSHVDEALTLLEFTLERQ